MWGSMRKEEVSRVEQVFGQRVGLGYWCLVRQSGCQFLGCQALLTFQSLSAAYNRLFLSQLASKAAITVTAISNAIADRSSMGIHHYLLKQLRFLLEFATLICRRVCLSKHLLRRHICGKFRSKSKPRFHFNSFWQRLQTPKIKLSWLGKGENRWEIGFTSRYGVRWEIDIKTELSHIPLL